MGSESYVVSGVRTVVMRCRSVVSKTTFCLKAENSEELMFLALTFEGIRPSVGGIVDVLRIPREGGPEIEELDDRWQRVLARMFSDS